MTASVVIVVEIAPTGYVEGTKSLPETPRDSLRGAVRGRGAP